MKRLSRYSLIIVTFLLCAEPALAQADAVFNTKYAAIYYSQSKDLDDFLWRLGGGRLEFGSDTALAMNRIDRIVERVEAILDMRPKNFKMDIRLHREPLSVNKVAFYERKSKIIHVSVDYATDGVIAHEIAHAVINQYFDSPIPTKTQEILTQYVDKYLWSDY